jgi:hypothetical protein
MSELVTEQVERVDEIPVIFPGLSLRPAGRREHADFVARYADNRSINCA